MPVAAMTPKARAATPNAPIMNRRVLRRIFSDSVLLALRPMSAASVITARLPQTADQAEPIENERGGGEAVRGPDELPSSDDDSVHTSSPASDIWTGGAAS